ncbi:uncharacterized protein LOC120641489 isoform X1 [Panicum virgatum]|uniref:uncharacterized protein LOC120641489 isoform X1 n=1 Tax=Panicum virgatum TaxID=38727 RepID=UPI0019D69381|nr:uncharacterized protein LOC120641489 isoform X1 [Panicum virgatum]
MPPPAVQALAGCIRRRPWLAPVRRYFCALEAVTHPGHWNRCFLVDMKALVSMNEEDMKSLGTPMLCPIFRVPGKRYYQHWLTKRDYLDHWMSIYDALGLSSSSEVPQAAAAI